MSETLKFDKNGQWSLDKAQIIDMKSKKTLANLPHEKTPRVSESGHWPSYSEDPEKPMSPARMAGKTIHPGSEEHWKNIENQKKKPGRTGSTPHRKLKKCEELLGEILETLEKMAVPGIKSNHIFSMDHINQVSNTPDHATAKNIAHEAIRSSSAHPNNKAKASLAVDQSKDHKHLAQTMTNFHMARDAKVRRRLGGQADHE
jgi:hypothetical protein